IEVRGRILCPPCFDDTLHGRKMQHLESSRTMHDSIALGLATIPALLFWPVIVTAPLSLYWTIRHWNSPRSILPRSRFRFYLAALLAVGEIAVVVFVIAAIWMVSRGCPTATASSQGSA